MNARMTLVGMENQLNYENKSLNDTWELLPTEEPIEDFDKDVLLATIMTKGGTFEPLYTDPQYFYWSTGMWWRKWRRNFTKWAEVLQMDYNPIENYNRNELEHNDTLEVGTLAQATHNQEVMDDDSTKNYTLDGTKTTESDGTSANTEVVDGETKKTNSNTEVVDGETSKTTSNTEVIDGEINRTKANKEVVDGEATKSGTTSETENKNNSGNYTTNLSVAGFNSASLEPKSGESNNHSDTDTISKNGTNSETSTEDKTTTNNGTEKEVEDRTVKDNGTESGTEDKTTTNNGTENATEDRTTTNNGTTHNEGSETSKDKYGETGTDDRTTTNNGTMNQNTNTDRDYDHKSHIWGNIGVTTSQQMIEAELKLRRWNLYEQIADIFCDEMCVRVY